MIERRPAQAGRKSGAGMKSQLIHEAQGQRTYVVVLDLGDEVLACLQAFAENESLSAAQISAIGAFETAVVGFWNWQRRTTSARR